METGKITVQEALETQGTLIHPIKGISMLPMLEEGRDMAVISRISDGTEPKVNDVVLFERDNGDLVLHRVTEIKKKKYVITGDNCLSRENVNKENVLGIMTGFYKGTKYVSADDPDYIRYVSEKTADFERRAIIKPVPEEWKQLIKLVFYAISGSKKAELPEDARWDALFRLSKEHNVTATVFRAIDSEKCPREIYLKWQQFAQKNLQKTILFDNERQKVYDAFRKNGIRFVPLKGILISGLYPEYGIREFADNDILIDKDRIDDTVGIMADLGYSDCHKGPAHYSYYRDDIYNFEIHQSLFKPDHEFYKFFEDAISSVVPYGNDYHECRMTDEDFYLHIIAHFNKHYSCGGTGLRSFADLWLLKEDYKKRNVLIDENKLRKYGLYDFDREIDALVRRLFFETDSLLHDDIAFVMTSGVYGTVSHSMENLIKKYGKVKYFFMRLFPSYSSMKEPYPTLEKFPILLPYYWIKRLVLFCFKPKAKRYIKQLAAAYKNDGKK